MYTISNKQLYAFDMLPYIMHTTFVCNVTVHYAHYF